MRMIIWLILVLMTIVPVFTALKDGSFTSNGRQKLKFPMSYHYEALYGDILFINIANYLVLQSLPQLSTPVLFQVFFHAVLYTTCLVGSCYLHQSWAPRLWEKPLSHFFRETGWPSLQEKLSPAGWLHLFFMPAAMVLAFEYTFFARHLPVQTVLTIGYLYLAYCLTAVMGYHAAISRGQLRLDKGKVLELTAKFAAVIIITVIKLL